MARVGAVVAQTRARGQTVIAISHDVRFAAECFRRVVVMREGRVVLDGTPAEVFAEGHWPELRASYLEPPLPAPWRGRGWASAPRRRSRPSLPRSDPPRRSALGRLHCPSGRPFG